MKIEVWNEPELKEEEKVLRLRLVQKGKQVSLKAVNVDGTVISGGNLADIDQDGIYIIGYVSDEVGIARGLDNQTKVRTADGLLN